VQRVRLLWTMSIRSDPTPFHEPIEPRTAALNIGEPAVNFLLESTWDEAKTARTVVNEWYRAFPNQRQISARIKSSDDRDHYGAIDELYVFSLLDVSRSTVRYEELGRGPRLSHLSRKLTCCRGGSGLSARSRPPRHSKPVGCDSMVAELGRQPQDANP
jgi:hypothetical protein